MENEVISYLEMCQREGSQLQKGMNFRLGDDHSVVLMSVRPNAPYQDREASKIPSAWISRNGLLAVD